MGLKALHDCNIIMNLNHELIAYKGQPGWGIAWYINNTIIPELVVERGRTYTFLVHGGNVSSDDANYHPFYITDSMNGGRLLNTPQQRMVAIALTF